MRAAHFVAMASSLQVRPATSDMFADVRDVLMEFGPGLGEADWRRLFDYDFDTGGVGAKSRDRGWVLCDGNAIVGFLGAIFSRRGSESFCNVTSWVVKKSHRSSGGLSLLMPMLALTDHTILNLSPTPFTRAVFKRMGFRDLEDRLVMIPPVYPQAPARGYRLVKDEKTIERLLSNDDLRVYHDHRRYSCTHLVFAGSHDYSYVVAGKTKLRRFPTSFIYYRSNPSLFRHLAGAMQLALLRAHRTLFSVVDARLCADAPLRGCPTYALHQPRLFRPATTSSRRREDIDTLYSEFVLLDPQRWTFNY
jgi:acetoacetyl-CoA synthetase